MSGRRLMAALGILLVVLVILLLGGLLAVDRFRSPSSSPRPVPPRRAEPGVPAPAPVQPNADAPTAAPPPSPPGAPDAAATAPGEGRYGKIRFRDAVSGEILRSFDRARIREVLSFQGSSSTELDDMRVQAVPGEEGWIKTHPPGPIDGLDASRSFWEFSLPGYETFRMVPGEDRDAQTIDLEPWRTRVRGRIVAPADEARPLRALLLSEVEDALTGSLHPRGLPETTGPFEIKDLSDGKWVLWAWTTDGGPRLHAVRRFERLGDVVDLGDLPLEPGSSFRARVVDGEGRTVEKPWLAGSPGLQPTAFRDMALTPIPGVVPVPSKEEGGWLLFEGLPADMPWKVRSVSIPGVEARVRTPEQAGVVGSVEIPWTGRRVRCRIRFTADGEESVDWGYQILLNSVPVEGWDRAGTLEAILPSGDYAVTGRKAEDAGSEPARPFTGPRGREIEVRGRLTIPAEETYEAVIDLVTPSLPARPR